MIKKIGYVPIDELDKRIITSRAEWKNVESKLNVVKDIRPDHLIYWIQQLPLAEALVLNDIYDCGLVVYKQIKNPNVTTWDFVSKLATLLYTPRKLEPKEYHGGYTREMKIPWFEYKIPFEAYVSRQKTWKVSVQSAIGYLNQWCCCYDYKLETMGHTALTYSQHYMRKVLISAKQDDRYSSLLGESGIEICTTDLKSKLPDANSAMIEAKIEELLHNQEWTENSIDTITTYFVGTGHFSRSVLICAMPRTTKVYGTTQDTLTVAGLGSVGTQYCRVIDHSWYLTDIGSVFDVLMDPCVLDDQLQALLYVMGSDDLDSKKKQGSSSTLESPGVIKEYDVIDLTKGQGIGAFYKDWIVSNASGVLEYKFEYKDPETAESVWLEANSHLNVYLVMKGRSQDRKIITTDVEMVDDQDTLFSFVSSKDLKDLAPSKVLIQLGSPNLTMTFVFKSGASLKVANLSVPLTRLCRRYMETIYKPILVPAVIGSSFTLYTRFNQGMFLLECIMAEINSISRNDLLCNKQLIAFQINVQIMKLFGGEIPNASDMIRAIMTITNVPSSKFDSIKKSLPFLGE